MSTEPVGPGASGGGEPAAGGASPTPSGAPPGFDVGSLESVAGRLDSIAPGAKAPAAPGQEGVEVKRSSIKPIPPREADGTFKKGEKDLNRHELGFKPHADRDASPEREFPGRKPKAPAAPIQGKPGEAAPDLPAADAAPVEGVPKPAPFKFAGRDWESAAHAEQSFRTLQGQYKPLLAAREAEEQKAHGWWKHSLELQDKLSAYESGQLKPGNGAGPKPAEASAAPGSSPSDGPFAGIDMGVFQRFVEQEGPAVAAAWLVSERAKIDTASTDAKIEAAIAPFRDIQARHEENQRVVGQVENLYSWASSQKNPDGTPMFGEFGDPQAEQETGEIVGWLCSQGMPEEVALSPVGLRIASALRRDAYGQIQPAAPKPTNQAAATVAAALLEGRQIADPVSGPSARTTQPGQPQTYEQQVKSEILNASLPDPELGFKRRSAPI